MTTRTVTTATVDRYLRLLRWPADLVTSMLPGTQTGPGPAARLIVDRADAGVRASLASILGDESLGAQATRRSAAADERERALDLRREASRRTTPTESQLRERHKEASRRSERASENASERRRAASESKRRRESNAATAQRQRTKVSEAQQVAAEQRIDERQAAAGCRR